MLIVGIDPGLEGAVAFLDGRKVLGVHSMPTTATKAGREEIDALALDALFDLYKAPDLVVIEEVNADPKFGASRGFSMGRNFGAALAVVQVRAFPHLRVRPQTWKKAILSGTDKSKEASIAHVRRRFPKLDLIPPGGDKPSHDWAEAVLLALYGLTV